VDVAPGQALRRRVVLGAAHLLALTAPDDALPAEVAERFELGAVVGTPERRHGGVNQLWRVRTTAGAFAVHALRPRPALVERTEAVSRIERAAATAGVAIAPPVPDPATGRAAVAFGDGSAAALVVVHGWVEAEPVDVDRSPASLYGALGASLGRLHGLGLGLDAAPVPGDTLDVRPTEAEWRDLAGAAREQGLPWAVAVADGAAELVDAVARIDAWDAAAAADDPAVIGHRDLTSQNVLDLDGTPVLIDWEDAGPIAPGTELGRTALDNVGRDGVLDEDALTAMVAGYAAVRPLPPVGRHWCSLWLRGLVVFAEHCARSCLEGTVDPALLRLQTDVLERTVPELRRRFAAVPGYVAAFEAAGKAARSRS
jgi:Ser/Thr protein kinase RdoA (MazF antagonist)